MNSCSKKIVLQGVAFCCLLFLWQNLNAQQSIKLFDKNDLSPVENATVTVYCGDEIFQAISDTLGRVLISACDSSAQFKIESLEYELSGTWVKYPTILYLERKTVGLEEAVIEPLRTDMFPIIEILRFIQPANKQPVDLLKLQSYNGASLSNALNSIPGLRFDERGQGGSRRLNIRGNFTRSAFGVRSLPLYIDDVPLTGPEGSTPLEIVDQEFLGSFIVEKGISSPEFGSANGGALILSSTRVPENTSKIDASIQIGSNGYLRQHGGFQYANQKSFVVFRQIHQQLEGFREQESNKKDQYFLNLGHTFKNKSHIRFLNIYYKGKWDLPGSLNAEEVVENPTQARAYSQDINASVSKTYLLNAFVFQSDISEKISHKSSIFINLNDKLNPYGTSPFFSGYKDENSIVYGLRTNWNYNLSDFSQLQFGTEFQSEEGDYSEFTNSDGSPHLLKYQNETTFIQQNSYLRYTRRFRRYTFEFSGTHKYYQTKNTGFSTVLDTSLSSKKSYTPEFLGSVKITKRIFWNSSIYLLALQGNSFPGLFELVDVETGYINQKLKPEKGLNLELGIKGFVERKKLEYQVNAYAYSLSQSILPGVDTLERLSYYNGNEARYFGIESMISKDFKLSRINTELKLEFSGAVQRYYSERALENFVPGVPLATGNIGLFIKHQSGLELNALHRYSDRLPLTDDNEDFLPANHILNVNLSFAKSLKNLDFTLSAGINNVLNSSYTSFPQLNATFGRYYNPAPGINYHTGFRVSYRFNN